MLSIAQQVSATSARSLFTHARVRSCVFLPKGPATRADNINIGVYRSAAVVARCLRMSAVSHAWPQGRDRIMQHVKRTHIYHLVSSHLCGTNSAGINTAVVHTPMSGNVFRMDTNI